jgi:formate dehydrogenase assembly factor FdhD
MADGVQPFDVLRFDERRSSAAVDRIAAAAPLEVRLEGQPFSVIMRTPGERRHGDCGGGIHAHGTPAPQDHSLGV